MKKMRILGDMIQKLVQEKEKTSDDISKILGCNIEQVEDIYKGRLFLSFSQLEKLAEYLGVTVDILLKGDIAHYEKTVVHCVGEFKNSENREKILDIIDDYLRLKNMVGLLQD